MAPDALGSVRQMVDPAGSATLAQSYDPFGTLLTGEGRGSSVFGYTGEQVDASTGLVYLRARYYSVRNQLYRICIALADYHRRALRRLIRRRYYDENR